MKIGVLASGGGSNLQAIIDATLNGALDAEVKVVVSNNASSGALARASSHGIPAVHISEKTHGSIEGADIAIRGALTQYDVELVALAGYMRKVGPLTLSAFAGRILNIHPGLLPDFGGPGMYGRRVHEAVLEAGRKTTGVTIHVADEEYDRGPVLSFREVGVAAGDTPDSLAARVLEQEHQLYVETLQRIASGGLRLPNSDELGKGE